MKLAELFSGPGAELAGDPQTDVTALAYDNRRVEAGTLFFCVPGHVADGHDFAPGAVEAGASALVVERPLELGVPEVRVPDARAAMAPAAARFFGDPTAEVALAGITGTNGKTTTAFLVRHLLESAGRQTGLLGTVKQVVGGAEETVERTTPEAIDLQATFRRMLDGGDLACAMEVSSHALALGRVRDLRFAAAAFTNLTQDHLDFHRDMEDYFLAKRRLFGVGDDAEASPERFVVNVDDPYGRRLADELASDALIRVSSRGDEEADLRVTESSFDATGARFTVVHGSAEAVAVALPLPGDFNVANAMIALAIALALGVGLAAAAAALADAPRVPGRFEPVESGQPFAVLVDYAHTPDSLENVLEAARRLTPAPRRTICVFGAGGDRDSAKRPLMGEIGARLADIAVVTSDNPRSEEPDRIIEQILAGIAREADGETLLVEPDRRAAIAAAFGVAQPGDTVVIAGKGHEQGQEFEGGRKIPFDDRDVAREELVRAGFADGGAR
jgi:UDP-N-acetylmuramoyl-L-alanyl-D-glutamate--2,6-diaminopimelate ligase